MVSAYDALADAILSVRATEAGLVTALLDGHRRAAQVALTAGEYEVAAGHMALFANEGDNAVGGIRKRLVEGGHHHNAAGEANGVYESGYVVVTKEAKKKLLATSQTLRSAETDDARKAAWDEFSTIAAELIGGA
jgi:hypothetical protein